jgi:hypothetical protein
VVEASGSWTNTGSATIESDGYTVYESDTSGATLSVREEVTVSVA